MDDLEISKAKKPAMKTLKDFTRRRKPIRQLDTSDLQQLQMKQVEVSVVRSDANHLLMTSLLEQLCHMYVPDRSVASQLFKKLCEQLSKLNIIAPLSLLDEMSGLRNQHRTMFNKILHATMKSLKQPLPALPGSDMSRVRLAPTEDDIIGQHTSRYKNEFREMELLGKGGFGSVYKAQNYLDGRQYAVKKIRFKHRHTHKLIKLLREVKALASLQHNNIVGYNAAWMEYDSPFTSSNSSSSTHSPRSKDTSLKSTHKSPRSTAQDKSLSIEFLSDADDELETEIPGTQSGLLPGGGGLAFCARAVSSVKVEEITSVDQNNCSAGVKKTKSKKDKKESVLSPRQRVKVVNIGSESHHFYSSENRSNNISGCFSVSENVSYTQSTQKIEITSQSIAQYEAEKSPRIPLAEKQISPYLLTKQSQGQDSSQSSVFETVFQPKDQDSPVLGATTSVMSHQHIDSRSTDIMDFQPSSSLRTASMPNDFVATPFSADSLSMSQQESISMSTNKLDSEHAILPMTRQGSLGFSPLNRLYQRHSSQPESTQFSRVVDENSSNSHIHKNAENKKIVPRRQYKRSVSYGAASDVEDVIELCNHDDGFYNSITLYIQMELCSITLQEWLVSRNSDFSSNGFGNQNSMCAENMHIFHQLLQGVQFIHNCGVIHRDLKPRNIFLSTNDLHVKIGDFGLAKIEVLSQGSESFSVFQTWDDVPFINDNHTSGVGTSAYASPEQLQGSFYDSKSDMFSLGVILFEIFNIFCTEMERAKSIESLRNQHQCHGEFREQWPSQSETVEALTSPEPGKRPSALDLLNNDLFLSQGQKIERLQERVKQQDAEINKLKKELLMKNRMIAHMQTRFEEFFPHFSPFSPFFIDQ